MILNFKRVRPMVIALLVLGAASTFLRGQGRDSSDRAAALADDADPVDVDAAAETEAVEYSGNLTTNDVSSSFSSDSHGDSRRSRLSEPTVSYVPVYSTTSSQRVQDPYAVPRKPDPVDVENSKAIRKSVQKLRAAEDHNTRNEAAADLKKLLETAFDRDYERRNNELARLEERVTKLRAQLDRRKESRDDIIDVRVKSLLYEAEGIGFPDELGAALQPLRDSTIHTHRGIRPVQTKPPAQPVRTRHRSTLKQRP